MLLPFELAGRRLSAEERAWVDTCCAASAWPTAPRTGPASCPAASSSGWRSPGRWRRGPQIVVADEPTGNLDTRSSREVLSLLRTASREYDQTIAMVTHDPVAASYADRILVIADGRIVGDHRADGAAADRRPADLASRSAA